MYVFLGLLALVLSGIFIRVYTEPLNEKVEKRLNFFSVVLMIVPSIAIIVLYLMIQLQPQ